MAKAIITLLFISLLLSASLTQAARPQPKDTKSIGEVQEKVEEGCEGVGEDECLMRRTLSAHIDYIYTQNGKP